MAMRFSGVSERSLGFSGDLGRMTDRGFICCREQNFSWEIKACGVIKRRSHFPQRCSGGVVVVAVAVVVVVLLRLLSSSR